MFYDGQVFYGSDVRVSCSTTFAKLICIPKYVLMHLLLRFCTFMIKNCPFTLMRESGVATAYLIHITYVNYLSLNAHPSCTLGVQENKI